MNKKLIAILFVSLFLLTAVSAESCNPSYGYNKCYEFSYSDSYADCNARSYTRIEANDNVKVEDGEIEKSYGTYYATGPTYLKYNIQAKYGAVYENFDGDIKNKIDCNKNGCGLDDYKQGKYKTGENKYYLTKSEGQTYSECPMFLGVDHKLTEKSSCWVWVYSYSWWGWNHDKNCLNVEQVECISGKDKCEGNNYYKCENYEWKNKGKTEGECGVECKNIGETRCDNMNTQKCENYKWVDKGKIIGNCDVECKTSSDCSSDSFVGELYCKNGNVVKDYESYSCSDYKCESSKTAKIQEKCDFGCGQGQCLPEPQEPETSGLSKIFQYLSDWINSIFNI